MSHPRIKLKLENHGRTYTPGEALSGSYSLDDVAGQDVRAVELSVLWHTEGKGDEDMSVHHFERVAAKNGEAVDFAKPQPFRTVLPNSPLSYSGLIIRICWRVRVRVFLHRGKELSLEVPFQLGRVPRAREAVT
jgi:hypothetical protein